VSNGQQTALFRVACIIFPGFELLLTVVSILALKFNGSQQHYGFFKTGKIGAYRVEERH
jgi:hypothetical protein